VYTLLVVVDPLLALFTLVSMRLFSFHERRGINRGRLLVLGLLVFIILFHMISHDSSLSKVTEISTIHSERTNTVTEATNTDKNKNCAPREGLIVLNVLGLLANDLFETAFANRLSEELCWPIVYRPWWNAEFPSQRGYECFPNAHLPHNHKELPDTLSTSLLTSIQLNASMWREWTTDPLHESVWANDAYLAWLKRIKEKSFTVEHLKFDFTGNGVENFVTSIRSSSCSIQVVDLQAFFIHYDWIRDWMPKIRQWHQISPECCLQQEPPEDAVEMHVRDFKPTDGGYNGLTSSVYTDILNHYNMTGRPLWVVCQPKTAVSPFVIQATSSGSVTIVTGIDQYDAFCTLTRAKTLILSYVSSFSQMAALLNSHYEDVEVHYPLTTLYEPEVTLQVPGWKYHLVKESKDAIEEWDVGYERVKPKMA